VTVWTRLGGEVEIDVDVCSHRVKIATAEIGSADESERLGRDRMTESSTRKAKQYWPKPSNNCFWTFKDVFAAEYRDIYERCGDIAGGPPGAQSPTVENGLVGLALSGGGNRSSTFCLGVLQALNASGALRNVHYLSTVSGGGYIGTAMTVGMSLNGGKFPFDKTGQDVGETPETRHLRHNSRYLLQDGARSLIPAAAIYMRGIVMNLIVVLPFLLAAAAVLVLLKPDTGAFPRPWPWMKDLPAVFRDSFMPLSLLGLAVVLALLLVYAIGVSIVPIVSLQKRRRIAIMAAVVMCAFGAVVFLEIHLLLLRVVFASHGSMTSPVSSGSPANVQVADTLVEKAGKVVAWVTPLVLAVLPFLKSIAAKAVSEAAGGFSETLKRWLSLWVAKYKSGGDRSLKQTAAMWPPRVTVKRGWNC
jgi:hypothetical protein